MYDFGCSGCHVEYRSQGPLNVMRFTFMVRFSLTALRAIVMLKA
jgi:hypothetical protein